MRSNSSGYSSAPAGNAKALHRKPKPRRPKQEMNTLMLMVFFIVLPVLGLGAVFFQPVRWVFLIACIAGLLFMWGVGAFKAPGRMIISALYAILMVITLVSALTGQSSSVSRIQQTMVSAATAVPTETPAFSSMLSTMNTSVPDDYYSFDDTAAPELNYGTVDPTLTETEFSGTEEPVSEVYVPGVKSESEIVLENFMEKWRKGIIADMVEYTAPSWRAALDQQPQQQLFWKFAQRPLLDWRQMGPPTGSDTSTARTISLQADVTYGQSNRTYSYDAITLYEDGAWFVDPDSLSSGILVEAATPTPDPNATPTPSPAPTPTPTPGPKTKLYYNKDGGKLYHLDPDCTSIASRYRPLKSSFTYKDINKSPYNKLKPCTKCNAPERP